MHKKCVKNNLTLKGLRGKLAAIKGIYEMYGLYIFFFHVEQLYYFASNAKHTPHLLLC